MEPMVISNSYDKLPEAISNETLRCSKLVTKHGWLADWTPVSDFALCTAFVSLPQAKGYWSKA
jgi:hypothetical protein